MKYGRFVEGGGKGANASLETAVALVLIIGFAFGARGIFNTWLDMNNGFIRQARDYQAERVHSGGGPHSENNGTGELPVTDISGLDDAASKALSSADPVVTTITVRPDIGAFDKDKLIYLYSRNKAADREKDLRNQIIGHLNLQMEDLEASKPQCHGTIDKGCNKQYEAITAAKDELSKQAYLQQLEITYLEQEKRVNTAVWKDYGPPPQLSADLSDEERQAQIDAHIGQYFSALGAELAGMPEAMPATEVSAVLPVRSDYTKERTGLQADKKALEEDTHHQAGIDHLNKRIGQIDEYFSSYADWEQRRDNLSALSLSDLGTPAARSGYIAMKWELIAWVRRWQAERKEWQADVEPNGDTKNDLRAAADLLRRESDYILEVVKELGRDHDILSNGEEAGGSDNLSLGQEIGNFSVICQQMAKECAEDKDCSSQDLALAGCPTE
ncbi:MAG: hypothetical protein ACE5GG_00335 [Candidatus Omnitrophota bacterium]